MSNLAHYIQFASTYMSKADTLEKSYQFTEAITEYYNAIVNLEQIIKAGNHPYQSVYEQQLTYCRERVNVLNNAGTSYNQYNTATTAQSTSAYSMSVAGSYDQYNSNSYGYNQYATQPSYTDPYTTPAYNAYTTPPTTYSSNATTAYSYSNPSYTSSVSDTYTNPYTPTTVTPSVTAPSVTVATTTPTYSAPTTAYTPPPSTANTTTPTSKDMLFPLRLQINVDEKTQQELKQKQDELVKLDMEKKKIRRSS